MTILFLIRETEKQVLGIQLALPFSLLIPSRIHSPRVGATHIQTYLKHLHRPTQRCVSHGIPNSVKLIMKINQHKLFWGTNLFHYVSQESLQFRSLLPQLLKSTLHTTHCCHLCGETNALFLSTQTYLRSSRQTFFGEKYFISTIFVVCMFINYKVERNFKPARLHMNDGYEC